MTQVSGDMTSGENGSWIPTLLLLHYYAYEERTVNSSLTKIRQTV